MVTLKLGKEDLNEIKSLLHSGEVVAFPTDTVFGIGVIYKDGRAVEKMKQAKGRDAGKPFPLMVRNYQQLCAVAHVDERVERVVRKHTPGPLTLVLKRKRAVKRSYVNGFSTVAVRIPDDPFVLRLLEEVGPMFVTSANMSGQKECNSADEVLEQLSGRIAAVVEGEAGSRIASTIIDFSGKKLKCLREGAISPEEIRRTAEQE